jgi:hypothetical protein
LPVLYYTRDIIYNWHMLIHLFSLKLEDVELQLQDANLHVSSPINQVETQELILGKLRKLNLTPDFKTIKYLVKDDDIYVEGTAHTIAEPVVCDLIY